MTYLKHVENFKHSDSQLKTKKFEEIQALYEKIKRSDEDFIVIGSAEDERMIKEMNEKGTDSSKDDSVKEEVKEEEGTKKRKNGHIKMIARKKPKPLKDVDGDEEHRRCLKIVTFEGTIDSEIMETKSFISRLDKTGRLLLGVIHMLVERKYPLSKDLLQKMLDLRLEVERESTVALDLIRFI
ncbi:hypothetical protein Tco_1550799, partial [Tanacetum coccineum]